MSYICVVTCMKPKPTVGLKYFPEKTVGQVVRTDCQDRTGPQLHGMRTVSPTSLSQYYRIHKHAREYTHMHILLYRPTRTYLKIQTHSYLHFIRDALCFRSINP